MRKTGRLISFLLCLFFLSGCERIIQPSREELVSANVTVQEAKEWDVAVNFSNNDLSMWYETKIVTDSHCTIWNGTATVYYLNAYFTQECQSITTEEFSAKEWRGNWVETDLKSPTTQLERWLGQIAAGECLYWKQPVIPAELSDSLQDFSEACYCLQLDKAPVDWTAMCDVCPDSTFGKENLWDSCSAGTSYLFFNVETLDVDAIYITMTDSNRWYEVVIGISDSETNAEILVQKDDLIYGTLSEEWEMSIVE